MHVSVSPLICVLKVGICWLVGGGGGEGLRSGVFFYSWIVWRS